MIRWKPTRFEIYDDAAGEWRWRLISSNGKIIADSAEGYANKSNAMRAAKNVRRVVIYRVPVVAEVPR